MKKLISGQTNSHDKIKLKTNKLLSIIDYKNYFEDLPKNIQKKSIESNDSQTNQFSEISEDFSNLDGWSRNPFEKFQEPKNIVIKKESDNITQNQKVEEPTKQAFELNALDKLNIETAVSMGDRAFVTINGKTYREGDLIDDALIEKIENEQVTFRVGTTTIIKNVGI